MVMLPKVGVYRQCPAGDGYFCLWQVMVAWLKVTIIHYAGKIRQRRQ